MKRTIHWGKLSDKRGMSLIETLLALGLLAIISVVLGNIILSQSRQMRRLFQRGDALEFRNQLSRVLSDSSKCLLQIQGLRVDVSTNPSPTVHQLPALYDGSVSVILAQPRTHLFRPGTGVVINNILFHNIRATGVPNEFSAEITVNMNEILGKEHELDPASTEPLEGMALKPVTVPFVIQTSPTDPPNNAAIVGCKSENTQKVVLGAFYETFPVTFTSNPPHSGNRNSKILDRTIMVPSGVSKVILQMTVVVACIGGDSNAVLTLDINGTEVLTQESSIVRNFKQNIVYFYFHETPAPGPNRYEVYVGNNWTGGCAWQPRNFIFTATAAYDP